MHFNLKVSFTLWTPVNDMDVSRCYLMTILVFKS